jgi:hypothetical protein
MFSLPGGQTPDDGMIIKLGLQIGVGQHFMERGFQIRCPSIQTDADPLLDLDGCQTKYDPNKYKPNGNFDHGAQIHVFLLDIVLW